MTARDAHIPSDADTAPRARVANGRSWRFEAFRYAALVEGCTTLGLFYAAMPIKYVLGDPAWVKVWGNVHGAAFTIYLILMVVAFYDRGFGIWAWLRSSVLCLIPFGTFFNDPWLRAKHRANPPRVWPKWQAFETRMRARDLRFDLFRITALVEGCTTLGLFYAAMPIKYVLGDPAWVKVWGNLHGAAFTAYLITMVIAFTARPWSLWAWARSTALCFIPFGTFFNDPWLVKKHAQLQGQTG